MICKDKKYHFLKKLCFLEKRKKHQLLGGAFLAYLY